MKERLLEILRQVEEGRLTAEQALEKLKFLPFHDLGSSKVDLHRRLRRGIPEVIYGQHKTAEQIVQIARALHQHGEQVIITRIDADKFRKVGEELAFLHYNPTARMAYSSMPEEKKGLIAVVSAGTSDEPVAEEAALTCELFGAGVERIYDAGIAGPHRFGTYLPRLQEADVVIAVAGMEGALPSLIAALISTPVIAVPTSVGYGTSFGGLSALLTMLNSCSSGVAVVNIDNGFAAAVFAVEIVRKIHADKGED